MTNQEFEVTSDNLVTDALDGDPRAIGTLFDQHADAIFSFCRARLATDVAAANATRDVFVRAAARLPYLATPSRVSAWLFAIAQTHLEIVDDQGRSTGRRRSTQDPVAERADVDLRAVESSSQLWSGACERRNRDFSMLELHMRHGLLGNDLAAVLGVERSEIQSRLDRLRSDITAALAPFLVARDLAAACIELDALLAGWDGEYSVAARSRVDQHRRSCATCGPAYDRIAADGVPFGLLSLSAMPSSLRGRVVGEMGEALGFGPAVPRDESPRDQSSGLQFADVWPEMPRVDVDDWTWMDDGFPERRRRPGRRPVVLAAAAVLILLVMLGVGAAIVADSPATVEVAGSVELQPREVSEPLAGTRLVGTPNTAESEGEAAVSEGEAAVSEGEAAVSEGGAADDIDASVSTPSTTPGSAPVSSRGPEDSSSVAIVTSSTTTPRSGGPVAPTTSPVVTSPRVTLPTVGASGTIGPTSQTTTTTFEPSSTGTPTTTSGAGTSSASASTTTPGTTNTTTSSPTTTTSGTSTTPATTTTTTPATTTTAATTTTTTPATTTTTSVPPPNEAPTVSEAKAVPRSVQASGVSCPGRTTSARVDAFDPDGTIALVVATWSGSGQGGVTTTLNSTGPTTYAATIGPWVVAGTTSVRFEVTDNDGATTTVFSDVEVRPCPGG